MNRLFPRVVSAAAAGSALGLALLSGACSPNNDVPPGAPVLVTFAIFDGASFTNVTADTVDCPADITDSGDCDPDAVTVCRFMAKTYCHCDKKPDGDATILPEMPTTNGVATCTDPAGVQVYAVFDRLLDTTPISVDGGQDDLVDFAANPTPAVMVSSATTYNPDGTSTGVIFSPDFFGAQKGPNLIITAAPTMPSDSDITLTLKADKVRAKDGKTGFKGKGGFLVAGLLTLKTQPFAAQIAVPQPATMMVTLADAGTDDGGAEGGADDSGADGGAAGDAGTPPTPMTVPPDATPVTITFNNVVDDTIAGHIHVTAGGIAYTDVSIDTSALPTVKVTPTTTWTASTDFTVTVDAAAADIVGDKLGGTGASGMFTTGAM
jgi:hypothetical protein